MKYPIEGMGRDNSLGLLILLFNLERVRAGTACVFSSHGLASIAFPGSTRKGLARSRIARIRAERRVIRA